MAKTRQQLEKDVNALVKAILSDYEALAALSPEEASEPYAFEMKRNAIVRRIWGVYKECLSHDPGAV